MRTRIETPADLELPVRSWLTTGALTIAWFQPLAIHRAGVPIGSLALAAVAVVLTLDHLKANIPLPGRRLPQLLAYLGLVWVTAIALVGGPISSARTWLAIFLAIFIGPMIASGANRRAAKRCIFLSAQVGLSFSILAVAIQRFSSPTLWGLITAPQNPDRTAGLSANPNAGAAFILFGLVVVWGIGCRRDATKLPKIFNLGLFLAGTWALLQTGSRGALLGLVVAVFAGLYLDAQRDGVGAVRNWRKFSAVLGLIAAMLVYRGYGPSGLQSFLADRGRIRDSNDRTDLWGVALDAIGSSPIIGVPEFSYLVANNAHNAYLDAALRFGIPGALIFVALLGSFALPAFASGRAGIPAIMLLIGGGVHSLTHTGILENAYFWIVAASLVAVALGERTAEPDLAPRANAPGTRDRTPGPSSSDVRQSR